MNRELTNIQASLKQCHGLIHELEGRVADGTETSLGTIYDRLMALAGQLPDIHATEMSSVISGSTATRTLATSAATTAAVTKIVGGLNSEDLRKIRRRGLDTKYIGIRDEGELFDMRHAESKAKGGQ